MPDGASLMPRMIDAPIIVVLPAYNEEADLPDLLSRLASSLDPWADYQILVVDDGSKDGTAEIVRRAALHMPVELIQHLTNQGLGAAMRTGLRAAAREDNVVVALDADNSQDPALIRRMVEQLAQGYDVVIASRFQVGSQEVGVPPIRKVLSHVSSAGLRLIVRLPGVRDYTCGFRAYRGRSLQRLIGVFGDGFIRENGFSCMLELLLNLRTIGVQVSEVPLVLRYDLKRGQSKMRVFRTMWRYLVTVTRGHFPLAFRTRGPRAAAIGPA